jgi:antitoxin component YwqK of YwqJK toxin-antitoxin module
MSRTIGQADEYVTRYTCYADGRVQSVSRWKNGLQDGRHVEWHANGKRARECTYTKGRLDGIDTAWYEDETPRWKMRYVDGWLDGICRRWSPNNRKYEAYV